MFRLFKPKKQILFSPVDGNIVKLEDVPDEVFSAKLAGDGMAIMPHSNTFVAPISGVVSKIFSTNHAFSIRTKNGLEVMVHIGLDTVELNGEGFKALAKEGDKVSVGKPIISADLAFIESKGKPIVTPIVVNHKKDIVISSDKIRTIREGEELMSIAFK